MGISGNTVVAFADELCNLANQIKEANKKLPEDQQRKVEQVMAELNFESKLKELRDVANKFNTAFKSF